MPVVRRLHCCEREHLLEPVYIENKSIPQGARFLSGWRTAHFSFRQHDVDVNDGCHVRLDSQVVLRFYLHGIL